jgi:hypothetical protein
VDDALSEGATSEFVCPHCKRPFEGQLITSPEGEPQGFKCPHCRLFVALDRAAPAA